MEKKPRVRKHHVEPALTDAEDALQAQTAQHIRDLYIEVLHDMTDDVDDSELGLQISGGVDSLTIAAALIAMDRKPRCYTIQIANNPVAGKDGKSTDLRTCEQFCAMHDLELHYVVISDDEQSKVISDIEHMAHRYPLLVTQPDFEVGYLYRRCFEQAHSDGITTLINGLDPLGPHIYTFTPLRESKRRYQVTSDEVNAMLIDSIGENVDQATAFAQMARDEFDMEALAPLVFVAIMLPYLNTSRRIIDYPHLKSGTIRAFASELKNVRPKVRMMQKGNSGADLFFDRMGLRSKLIADALNVSIEDTSIIKWVNYLRRTRESNESSSFGAHKPLGPMGHWPMFWTISNGESLPDFIASRHAKFSYTPPYEINADGSPAVEQEDDSVSLFDISDESFPVVAKNTLGDTVSGDSNDIRTDCWGRFLNEGWMASCPRARAGLCTIAITPDSEKRHYEVESCTQWPHALTDFWNTAERASELLEDTLWPELYYKWRAKAVALYNSSQKWRERTAELQSQIDELESQLQYGRDDLYGVQPWIIGKTALEDEDND